MTRNPSGDGASRGDPVAGRLRRAIEQLLGCTELSLDELEESTRLAIGRVRQLLAESTSPSTERGVTPTARRLAAMCRQVAETAENWVDCSDLREVAAVFRELGLDCRRLLSQTPAADEVPRYVLYDFDMDDLATTHVYESYNEAADDASQLDNVIVAPLVFEQQVAAAVAPAIAEGDPYCLRIDGPTFRTQRELLARLEGLASQASPYQPAPGDREALEGLVELVDELADQAHDRHGIDCLLVREDDGCD
jgi:hypothetical protein